MFEGNAEYRRTGSLKQTSMGRIRDVLQRGPLAAMMDCGTIAAMLE
jgi:hypothetical protein